MVSKKKAWVVTVDMGYGHHRAAYPLKDIANERIISANDDKIIMPDEQKRWIHFQNFYENISRFKSFPLVGRFVWDWFEKIQSIPSLYPFRDLSRPSFSSLYLHRLINKGCFKSITDYTKKKKIPFVSTFFATAIAAAHEGMKDVYCVVTDTDINRVWVPEHPKKEKLYYLIPTERSKKRLMAYGVPEKNIFFTGFPLPKENVGKNLDIVKRDLGKRLPNLDPRKIYTAKYKETLKKYLGKNLKKKSDHILTITFSVGGAGAQKEIGVDIIKSLKHKIRTKQVRLNLVSGTRIEVSEYYKRIIREIGLGSELGKGVNVISKLSKKEYFKAFNDLLHETDILWTKPSELSFYTALGLPIIMCPALGAHEAINEEWLIRMGTGFKQENPKYTDEWLFDWLNKGILAEAAWEGFDEAPKFGTYNIEKIIFSKNKNSVKMQY